MLIIVKQIQANIKSFSICQQQNAAVVIDKRSAPSVISTWSSTNFQQSTYCVSICPYIGIEYVTCSNLTIKHATPLVPTSARFMTIQYNAIQLEICKHRTSQLRCARS